MTKEQLRRYFEMDRDLHERGRLTSVEESAEFDTLEVQWEAWEPDQELARLRAEVRRMQIAAEQRNRQLDALHVVWCDGGCEGGMHRFDGRGPSAITQEIVDAAVVNTERLKRWWANRRARCRDEGERQS